MRTSRIAMTALILAPAATAAEELDLGVRTGIYWTENAQGISDEGRAEEDDDFSGRITPLIGVRDPDGELTWSLRYEPSYERFLDQSEISGFDHVVAAAASWKFAERWTFSLTENYSLNQNTVRFNEAAAPGEEVTLGFRDQEVRSNRTTASLSHLLSPRDTLALNLSYYAVEFPDGGRSDRSTPSLGLLYNHTFSERTSAGLDFSWIQQKNRASRGGANDDTFFYNLSGTLRYLFSPTFRLEASAGPTLVDSAPPDEFEFLQFGVVRLGPGLTFALDADQCAFQGVPGRVGLVNYPQGCTGSIPQLSPRDDALISDLIVELPAVDEQGNPADDSGEIDLTYFANLELVKEWEYWTGSAGYRRSNSETARFGSSSVADTFWLTLTWNPGALWTVKLSAAYSLQEQASDVEAPFAFQLVNVPAPAGVTSVAELAEIQAIVMSTRANEFDYETQNVALSVVRRLSRRASASLAVNWYGQEQDISFQARSAEGDNLSVSVGLNWTFDPIRF